MLPEIDEIFEVVVDSAFVGMRKPEPGDLRAQRSSASATASSRRDCVFVDDIELNCDAARELGMAAVRFETTEQAMPEIEAALAPSEQPLSVARIAARAPARRRAPGGARSPPRPATRWRTPAASSTHAPALRRSSSAPNTRSTSAALQPAGRGEPAGHHLGLVLHQQGAAAHRR